MTSPADLTSAVKVNANEHTRVRSSTAAAGDLRLTYIQYINELINQENMEILRRPYTWLSCGGVYREVIYREYTRQPGHAVAISEQQSDATSCQIDVQSIKLKLQVLSIGTKFLLIW